MAEQQKGKNIFIRPQERACSQKASDILDDKHCLFEHQIELQILNAEKIDQNQYLGKVGLR